MLLNKKLVLIIDILKRLKATSFQKQKNRKVSKMYVKKLKLNIGTTISDKMNKVLIKNNALRKYILKRFLSVY